MSSLEKILSQELDQLPRMLLRPIIERKLTTAEPGISPQAVDALVDHVSKDGDSTFTWRSHEPDVGDDLRHLSITFDDADEAELKESIDKLISSLPAVIQESIEQAGCDGFKALRKGWEVEGAIQRYETVEFCDRLYERWSEGLDLLRMLLTCCRELGAEAHNRYRRSKSKRQAYRRFALVRLHARACQVSEEIVTLMENGLADGAMARWRTLYELTVVATLIADGDEILAERYLCHDSVDQRNHADDFDKARTSQGLPPIGNRVRHRIDKNHAAVIARFGAPFGNLYGWASELLKKRNPTFKDLQEAANRNGMIDYYRMATFNVHAGARAIFFRLTAMGDTEVILAGRSNAGLAEPGQHTAFSLVHMTSLLLGLSSKLDRVMEMRTLIEIRDAIPQAFSRADRRLHHDEMTCQKQRSKRSPGKRRTVDRKH